MGTVTSLVKPIRTASTHVPRSWEVVRQLGSVSAIGQEVLVGPDHPAWRRFDAGRGPSINGPECEVTSAGVTSRRGVRPANGLRLTPRGRLAVTIAGLVLLCIAVFSVAVGQAVSAPSVDRMVVVVRGQSLADVAQRELPGVPVVEGIVRIRLANRMNTTDLHPGQVVVIPSKG